MSDAEAVRRILAEHRPDLAGAHVAPLGAGTDHAAYEVDGGLIVRFAADDDPARRAAATEREARVLEAVASCSPLPTPRPELVLPEHGCLAYRKLRGAPLLQLPPRGRLRLPPAVHVALGAFLTAIHGLPVDRMTALAGRDDEPPGAWLEEAAEAYAVVGEQLPASQRRAVEAFLAAPSPAGDHEPAFCHDDLGAEHLLADLAGARLTGVIDWGDATVTDPAHDLGLVLRDLGPQALAGVLRHYERDAGDREALRERAVFHARCKALEDAAYGVTSGRRAYAANGLAAIGRLFRGAP